MFELEIEQKFYADEHVDHSMKILEMFHADTPPSVKDYVLTEIGKNDSPLRILVSTVAFGMGIDCKGINRIIHFRPSKSLESYLQECGRADRDNTQSHCYLLYNGFLGSKCGADIKSYISSDICKRKLIEANFPKEYGGPIKTRKITNEQVLLLKEKLPQYLDEHEQDVFNDVDSDEIQEVCSTPIENLEEELEEQWIDIRDDSNISMLGDSSQLQQLDHAMDALHQSGSHNQSIGNVINFSRKIS
eukprot:gene13121-14469_t